MFSSFVMLVRTYLALYLNDPNLVKSCRYQLSDRLADSETSCPNSMKTATIAYERLWLRWICAYLNLVVNEQTKTCVRKLTKPI